MAGKGESGYNSSHSDSANMLFSADRIKVFNILLSRGMELGGRGYV